MLDAVPGLRLLRDRPCGGVRCVFAALPATALELACQRNAEPVPTVRILERTELVQGVPEARPAWEVVMPAGVARGVAPPPRFEQVGQEFDVVNVNGFTADTPAAAGLVDELVQSGLSAPLELRQLLPIGNRGRLLPRASTPSKRAALLRHGP